jgi:hypothetical protein
MNALEQAKAQLGEALLRQVQDEAPSRIDAPAHQIRALKAIVVPEQWAAWEAAADEGAVIRIGSTSIRELS